MLIGFRQPKIKDDMKINAQLDSSAPTLANTMLADGEFVELSFSEKFGQIFSDERMAHFTIWEKGKRKINSSEKLQFEGTLEELVQLDLFWNNFSEIYYFPKRMMQADSSHFDVAKTFIAFIKSLYISPEKKAYLSKISPNTQVIVC